ncbi:MAG: hypothetical protein HC842_04040, partial [Cytophagales bacterium]|nr:hypothetical protein [Cytophagales bacterium]
MGIALPALLWAINGFRLEPSISHYFYTAASPVFTGVLIAFGLFLFTYRGSPNDQDTARWDSQNRLTNVAGFLALFTALVPTKAEPAYAPFCFCPDCGWGE